MLQRHSREWQAWWQEQEAGSSYLKRKPKAREGYFLQQGWTTQNSPNSTTNWETSVPKPEAINDISHSNDHKLITNFTSMLHDKIPQGFISIAQTESYNQTRYQV